jgi:lysophospholipase L1-like esterase
MRVSPSGPVIGGRVRYRLEVEIRRLTALVLAAALAVAGVGVWRHLAAVGPCELERNADDAVPQFVGSGPPAVVIGDSWADGYGLGFSKSFPAALARDGWRVHVIPGAGTGYVAPGACGQPFTRKAASVAPDTELVIVQGGLNDLWQRTQPAAIGRAVTDTVAQVRAQAPSARLLVIAPPERIPGASAASLAAVAAAVTGTATRAGIQVVATPRLTYQADGTHPSAAGQRVLADAIRRALR